MKKNVNNITKYMCFKKKKKLMENKIVISLKIICKYFIYKTFI